MAQSKFSKTSSENLLSMIMKKESKYTNYYADVVPGNFDSNGSTGYFFVFTDIKKDNSLGKYVDIWYGSGSKVSKIAEELDVYKFESVKLCGKTYFRYDLAYVTDSQTILMSVFKGKCIESFRAPGQANFDNDNSFTVYCSAYDMVKDKEYGYTTGHTWKNYYFFADSKGIHEYMAKQINIKDFNKYANGTTIMKHLKKNFSKKDTKVSYKFLKRSNNLIHINIDAETKESVNYYYYTYKIDKTNKLDLIDSGEGRYANAVTKLL